jgi:hypothetical protein
MIYGQRVYEKKKEVACRIIPYINKAASNILKYTLMSRILHERECIGHKKHQVKNVPSP